jgi:hypothetical protein
MRSPDARIRRAGANNTTNGHDALAGRADTADRLPIGDRAQSIQCETGEDKDPGRVL